MGPTTGTLVIRNILKTTATLCLCFATAVAEQVPLPPDIGALLPLSGQVARIGAIVRSGVEQGVSKDVNIVFQDERCDPSEGVKAFNALLARGVKLFLGPCCGSPQQAVAPLLKSKDAFSLLISSAPRAVFADSGEKMFSVQFAIEDESAYLAGRLFDDGIRKVVLLFADDGFSRTHEREFRKVFRGQILDTLVYPSGDIVALRSEILKLRSLQPDAVFIPEVSSLLLGVKRELKRAGQENLPVFSIFAAKSPDVLEANSGAAEGLSISYPDIGEEDALVYYPKLGAKILSEAASRCAGQPRCVIDSLKREHSFDQYGVLSTKFIVKTVRDGVWKNVR